MLVCKLFHCIASDQSLCKCVCIIISFLFYKNVIGNLLCEPGRKISLHRVKNVNKNMIHQIALMSPHHLKITDCKGALENDDIVEFFELVGNQLKVT